jgi:glycosyltransferase involved in cell wall biosynthesis
MSLSIACVNSDMSTEERGRILAFSPWPHLRSMQGGGGTPSLSNMLEHLTSDGYLVELVLPQTQASADDPLPGVRLHRVQGLRPSRTRIGRVLGFIRYNLRLSFYGYRLGRRDTRPRAVYGLSALTLPAAVLCASLLRRPSIGVLFGTFLYPRLGSRRAMLGHFEEVVAFSLRPTRLVVHNDGTQGDRVAARFHFPKSRLRFWMNGIDMTTCDEAAARTKARSLLGIAADVPLVVSSSRLVGWKRVDRVLEAFALVLAEREDAVLAVSGAGPERMTLERIAQALNLGPSVRFLGPLPRQENLELLAAADVFVALYDLSNVGYGLLEALSCGTAVVVSDSGATSDFVQDGETGLVVPVDDPEAAAGALLRFLNDSDLRTAVGTEARRRAHERFLTREQRRELELELLGEVGAR